MNLMEFIKRNLGFFVTSVIVLAIFAPTIFTLPWLECFNRTETGQIGDTIGGTTAPFWGFLSVILLYITLKEQQSFNKTQKLSSDLEVIMKLRDNISELSKNLEVKVIPRNGGQVTTHKGASYIEELRSATNPNIGINEDDFDRLYKSTIEIAELCLLYYNMVIRSSLDNIVKESFVRPVLIHSEMINRLFYLYKTRSICILAKMESVDDNLFERYKVGNEKLLKRANEMYESLRREHLIRE